MSIHPPLWCLLRASTITAPSPTKAHALAVPPPNLSDEWWSGRNLVVQAPKSLGATVQRRQQVLPTPYGPSSWGLPQVCPSTTSANGLNDIVYSVCPLAWAS
ncbi:hypothetical protein F5Y01DRAFT_316339 [Xylaria sp. FL0043]|nr:hypothetical protein F5Y01DRAFT_316339 [Xylaria sp. FL0043]